ncbi:MAG: NUDIX hydrolase [Gammaproteobacteria bacterium]|nr:MAG: NUDIX hydrolase [Gammaproteobacteria bacterium]
MDRPVTSEAPAITTDIVLFTLRADALQVLLIRRRNEPFKGMWALPGGFIEPDEPLEDGAARELEEEAGISGVYLEQLCTFGRPDRDPRRRVISVAYYALAPADGLTPRAASDAEATGWFPANDLPPLAFDHDEMVNTARERLAAKLGYSTIAVQFLPERFSLGDLQVVYETILNRPLDKRNFRKRMLAIGLIEATRDERRNGNHRPARLYTARNPGEVEIIK